MTQIINGVHFLSCRRVSIHWWGWGCMWSHEDNPRSRPSGTSHLLFDTGSLISQAKVDGLATLLKWPVSSRALPQSPYISPSMHVTMPPFKYTLGIQNSDPHTFGTSPLLNEPSPQLWLFFLLTSKNTLSKNGVTGDLHSSWRSIHLDNLKNYFHIYVVISSYTNLGIKLTTADNNSDQITKQCIYQLTTEHVKPSLCVYPECLLLSWLHSCTRKFPTLSS